MPTLHSYPLRSLFRLLVVVGTVLPILGMAYSLCADSYVSDDWKLVLQWSGDGGLLSDVGTEDVEMWSTIAWLVAFAALFVALVAAQIGLFFFHRWARLATVCLLSLSVLATPFLGLAVCLPFEGFCDGISNTIDGAILALAYFSPVRREFDQRRIA